MTDNFLKFLSNLNEAQKEAVLHGDGPLLIVAGAGTGKTKVITSRILHLIDGRKGSILKAKPSEILALTFTEKAAQEMVERVDIGMPLGYEEVWIKTFHGFAEKVLRESGHEIGLDRDYKLLNKLQQWMMMKKHLFEFELDYFRPLATPNSFIDTLITHFSRIKEEFISPEEYSAYADRKLAEVMEKAKLSAEAKGDYAKIDKKSVLGIEVEEVRKILEAAKAYKKYQEIMLKENCLDFGDLSYYVLKLFEERPSVLREYQNRFKYVMIDEFQDTNYAQFKLMMLLCGGNRGVGDTRGSGHRNICVVGDDDQSIFRWRGASLSNILQFQKEFPDAKKIVLTENYRSNQNILDASHHFIKFNDPDRLEFKEKISKKLKSQSKKKEPIETVHFDYYMGEVSFVVEKIKELVNDPIPYKDIAVLVRANAHALPFADEFKKAGIPFQIKTPKGLLSMDEIKDIIALVKVMSDRTNDVAMMRILKIEIFGIKMEQILDVLKAAKDKNTHISSVLQSFKDSDVLPGMETPLTSFIQFFEELTEFSKNRTAGEVINQFLIKSGYLDKLSSEFTLENQQKIENITAFSKLVWQFEKENEENSIIDFAEFLKLIEESNIPLAEAEQVAPDIDAVQILTTHGAKGLEFDTVFIVNLVDHRFPILNRKDPLHIPLELTKEIFPEGDFHIEEERRLFYVALTRAKRKIFLTYSNKYEGAKKWRKSQFLEEILESKLITEVEKVDEAGGQNPIQIKTFKSPIDTAPKSWINHKSFSYSQIDTFKICPLKYGYRYALNVPTPPHHLTNFGVSVHETLKDFYRILMADKSRATFDLMKELFEKNWLSSGYDNKEHEIRRREQGLRILTKFYEDNHDPWVIPAFIEKNFNIKIGDYMLTGRIDRIDKLPDGVYEVIDYKTSESKAIDQMKKLQLYLYALVCRDIFRIPATKLSFYFLEDGKKVSISTGYDELDSVKEDILNYIEQIRKTDFVPTPGFLCQFCDYRLICPAV
jgi:DNA helicase-2/ATP-dependent DNA helicase PcrA